MVWFIPRTYRQGSWSSAKRLFDIDIPRGAICHFEDIDLASKCYFPNSHTKTIHMIWKFRHFSQSLQDSRLSKSYLLSNTNAQLITTSKSSEEWCPRGVRSNRLKRGWFCAIRSFSWRRSPLVEPAYITHKGRWLYHHTFHWSWRGWKSLYDECPCKALMGGLS